MTSALLRLRAEEQRFIDEGMPEPEGPDEDAVIAATGFVLGAKTEPLYIHLAALIERVEVLETRLAEVETRGFKYCGVYQKAQRYARGDVVTYSGSAFVAIKDVVAEGEIPNASGCWQMFVQRGRDASSRDRRGE